MANNPPGVPQNTPPLPTPRTSSSTATAATSAGGSSSQPVSASRHPKYRGIRIRGGKWVSEIREPRKTTRIWLGTYPTPEMAAAAYDVAAMTLKGPDTPLNFPESILSYPVPASTSASDIQAAAAAAAQAAGVPRSSENSSSQGAQEETNEEEFIDEDALLNLPNLLVDMAEGMLVSPPRIESKSSSDESGGDGDGLWSYT